ncbi:MAG: hypothetical protein CL920_37310 [Deltaproteobacteria bacterium]|nr:hypothetical protein [Deltaproteobacteria bacterium]MBU54391.1 hypothetical protein [Deltaproteobacteria bacterium]
MHIRIIQWNIRINSDTGAILELLRSEVRTPTIVHLQEVSEFAFSMLHTHLQPTGSAFSLEYRRPGKNEGRNRRMGVATLAFGAAIVKSDLVKRSVFPERTLVAEVEVGGTFVRTLNFHSLTGVDYKKAKSSNFASLADFLESESIDFLCCDANEPKVDSLNWAEVEFFNNRDKGRCAAMIFGESPQHALFDSFKVHLQNIGEGIEGSPLAVSHVVTGRYPRRYDHIFHSPQWEVEAMSYDYESAKKATSDHAVVVADFSYV